MSLPLTGRRRRRHVLVIIILIVTFWADEGDARWKHKHHGHGMHGKHGKQGRPCKRGGVPRQICQDQDWLGWSPCSNCVRSRTKALCSGTISESDTTACRVDCSLSTWSEWSTCNVRCGKGFKTRRRYVVQSQACGGTACTGAMDDSAACDTGVCCPEDCQVSAWTEWTCSAKCMQTGKKTRTRTVSRQPSCGGASCPPLTEEGTCNGSECCPKDCVVSEWSEWASCVPVEGGAPNQGQRSRLRSVTSREVCGGAICPTDLSQTEACAVEEQTCKAYCVFSIWSEWSSCSATCGDGTMTRKRYIVKAQSCGDDYCSGKLEESVPCTADVCCPKDCEVNAWSAWRCTAKCGSTGLKVRSRTVRDNAECGGATCPPLSEEDTCDGAKCCPKDCVMSEWSQWSECSDVGDDGKGQQHRLQAIAIPESCGGKPYEPNSTVVETKECSVGSDTGKNWNAPRDIYH